jgi:hypothetical protein
VVVNFEVVGLDPDPFLQHVHTIHIRAKIGWKHLSHSSYIHASPSVTIYIHTYVCKLPFLKSMSILMSKFYKIGPRLQPNLLTGAAWSKLLRHEICNARHGSIKPTSGPWTCKTGSSRSQRRLPLWKIAHLNRYNTAFKVVTSASVNRPIAWKMGGRLVLPM